MHPENSKKINFLIVCLSLITCLEAAKKNLSAEEQMFTHVYESHMWWTGETDSGIGSNLHPTQVIRREIPKIIKQFQIQSMLDIPCGDFNWMQHVALDIPYIGADIVKDIIQKAQKKYGNNNRAFIHLDIITSQLPKTDLILCRDCLVHLPYEQVWQALKNIKQSGSKYFLTTSHTNTTQNINIHLGGWRSLNLLAPPFNFPQPLFILHEGGFEKPDKCLILWAVEDIPTEVQPYI